LVNESGVSIHHEVPTALFCAVAFIFGESRSAMVNRRYAGERAHRRRTP
jgi:hypothetical protein